jgi:Spy/CpxP family protein refolding chaperone
LSNVGERRAKKMKTKVLIGIGALIIVASLNYMAVNAYAESEEKAYGEKQKWSRQRQEKYDKLTESLGLSEEQIALLKNRKQVKMESREKLRSKLRAEEKALKQELEKSVSDDTKIKELADSIKNIHSEMVDERIRGILEIKAILTAEQYAEFKSRVGSYKDKKPGKLQGEEKLWAGHKSRKHKGY